MILDHSLINFVSFLDRNFIFLWWYRVSVYTIQIDRLFSDQSPKHSRDLFCPFPAVSYINGILYLIVVFRFVMFYLVMFYVIMRYFVLFCEFFCLILSSFVSISSHESDQVHSSQIKLDQIKSNQGEWNEIKFKYSRGKQAKQSK